MRACRLRECVRKRDREGEWGKHRSILKCAMTNLKTKQSKDLKIGRQNPLYLKYIFSKKVSYVKLFATKP